MSIVWLLMIATSIIYAFLQGNVDGINQVLLEIGKETFTFVIPLICIICFWNGILTIGKDAGLLEYLQRFLAPLLKWLFPDIKDDNETLGFIAANITANLFGLGSAATPTGLKAMKGMQEHNQDKTVATRSMITFLILNTAGITILPTTLIALRSSLHSLEPMRFVPYAILSCCFASLFGITIDRWWNHRNHR
ncbi:MAG: nucleoside recognition domain-containing protein [Erysipelotrichaceae bacterium]